MGRRALPLRGSLDRGGRRRIHYVDEGGGPTLLLLHGNPTWSFLYRDVITGLRESFRCIALDYPGFGLSTAPAGYGFTPAEHARVVERFVDALDLQRRDDDGPGLGRPDRLRGRHPAPDRFARFVIGNTWAWPKTDPGTQAFSRFLGGPWAAG